MKQENPYDADTDLEMNEFEDIIRLTKERLIREVLYELQTGGGVSFSGMSQNVLAAETHEQQLAAIRALVTLLRSFFQKAPARLAERLSRPNQRVLDVGAGRAPWSLAFVDRDSSTRVTAVDLPEQLPALREAVKSARKERRFELIGADIFGAEWKPTDSYDCIIIANVCHLFNEGRNQQLLARVAQLLAPGGIIAIVDQVFEEDPNWSRWSALYVLGVLHEAPGGYLFSIPTYFRWLTDVGLRELNSHAVCPLPPLTLVTAQRENERAGSQRAVRLSRAQSIASLAATEAHDRDEHR